MSKILVFYAHPNKDGHSGFFLKELIKKFDKTNKEYEIIDLYDLGYNPVLLPGEHYTSGHKAVSRQNKEIQEKISKAKKLVFIYPTWWQNIPAILKGFIDRIFVPDFAFAYKGSVPIGLLKNKKAVVFTNSSGPRFYTKFLAGDHAIKAVVKDTLLFCGIKAKAYAIGSALQLSESNKKKIKSCIEKGLKYLNN